MLYIDKAIIEKNNFEKEIIREYTKQYNMITEDNILNAFDLNNINKEIIKNKSIRITELKIIPLPCYLRWKSNPLYKCSTILDKYDTIHKHIPPHMNIKENTLNWTHRIVMTEHLIDIFEKALKKKSKNFYIEDNTFHKTKWLKYKGVDND